VTGNESTPEEEAKKLRRYVALMVIGIAGVVASAYFMVESAVLVARLANVPESLIGATIIAFGTSIPELSLTVRAFLKGQTGLGLGNIVGSGFINTTLILGISLLVPAVVSIPFSINMFIFEDLVIFSLISNLFMWYFLSAGRLTWKEAAIFLFIYALFLASALGALPLRQQQP
jgi:cation:H+ antiporter